jgi:hypothetical protein
VQQYHCKAFGAFRDGRALLHTVIVCHLLCLLHAAAIFVDEVVVFYLYISNPGFRATPGTTEKSPQRK